MIFYMASKRNRKPDQEVYHPPRGDGKNFDDREKSHERTFYNTNHRKCTYKTGRKEDGEENVERYVQHTRQQYGTASTYGSSSPGNYWNEFEYEGYYRDDYYNQAYINPRYYKRDNVSQKSISKYKPYQTYVRQQASADRGRHKNHHSSYKKSEPIIKEETPVKIQVEATEQEKKYDHSPRSRHNSHNRDFNDSRLFNPYKNDTEGSMKNLVKSNVSPDVHEGASNGRSDSHIHGGLIHLPDNLEINSSATSVQSLPLATMSHQLETKWNDRKPTVIVRPTFSHLITSSSVPFPSVSLVTGIQTIPAFIPVPPSYISPGTMNIYRTQPPSLTTPPLIQTMSFPSQVIQSPDEAVLFQVSNVMSKFPIVIQSVNTIKSLEAQLDGFIRSTCDITSADWWQSVNQIRIELKDLYKVVITKDLDYCNQVGIELNLWKSVFYSIMELIRTYISNPDSVPLPPNHKDQVTKIKANVINYGAKILQDGEEYFIGLYSEMSKSHNVNLEAIFCSRRPPPETASRTRKLVYLCAQKLFLFLGDLTRYSEIINNTCDYSKARIWYLKAQLLVPKNGRPYNQLAVISIYANRLLDALYYYTRTLAASNPFSTASQSLSFLFEDARRKGDERARRNQESLKRKKKKQNTNADNRKKGCIEIWIHPDDGTKEKRVTDDDDTDILAIFDNNNDEVRLKSELQIKEDFLSMPLIELNKVFTLSFLNCHGKLFGKINMEDFPEVCSTMLQELWGLLSHQPCPLTDYRLCHMLIINMYIMDRVSRQMSMNTCYTLRSLHQDHASRMTLDFFALLCQRAIEIINDWLENQFTEVIESLELPRDLSLMLPPICLWTDWMVTHPEYWNPLPSHRDPLLPPNLNDFGLIADLCTKVSRIIEKQFPGLTRPVFRVLTDSNECERAISNPNSFVLLEESLISGFLPMLDQIPKIYLLEDDKWTKEQTEDWIHLEKLSLFGDFLCGITPQFLDYNVDTCTYISTMIKEGSERQQDEPNNNVPESVVSEDVKGLEEDLDMKLRMEIEEINTTHATLGYDKLSSWADLTDQAEEEEREHQRRIASLKIKRVNSQFKEQKNRRFELWRKSLLDHEIAQRFVELEIRPLFLVLDINCYIDYLNDIDLLIALRRFIIVVPLIVVGELENLLKSTQLSDDIDIYYRCRQALRYLEDRFEKGDQNVKAITSHGTFMETITFRTEALNIVEGETNDDVILNCCQFLCKDKAREFMPREKDKPITLYRDVVLLTGDRNLRLKALSRHIPVKPLKRFMEWADIRRKC